LGKIPKGSWRILPTRTPAAAEIKIFGSFLKLARGLNSNVHRPATRKLGRKKGDLKMSGQQTITRTLIAAVGALLMSSVAVGSAIAPAHVAVAQAQTSANA